VMTLSALAAALLPFRARALYQASPGAKFRWGNLPLVTVLGGLGFALGAFMVGSFLFVKDLGLAYSNGRTPYVIVLITAMFGLIVYFVMRTFRAHKGIKVEYAFAEIPPE